MKNQMKGKKGITLIALVITILVILILAGVTVATLTGDNGLLTKAGNAKNTVNESEIEEQIKLAYQDYYLGQHTETGYTFKNALDEMFGKNKIDNVKEKEGVFTVIFKDGREYTYNVATGKIEKVGKWNDNGDGSFTYSETGTKVKIGDKVNYNEGTGYTYTTDTTKGIGGSVGTQDSTTGKYPLNSKTYTTEDLTWRVLGVNEKGKIELISENPMSDTNKVYLANEEGYLYGPNELNTMCNELYGKGTVTVSARSLNVDDINKLAGITTDAEKKAVDNNYGSKWKYRYPTTEEVSGTRYMQYNKDTGSGYSGTWTNITNSSYQTFRMPGKSATISSKKPGYSPELTATYYNYIISQKVNKTATDGKSIADLLAKGTTSNNIGQWLTSSCVACGNEDAIFGVRDMSYGGMYGRFLFYSFGASGSHSWCVRPVVTLESNIQISGSSSEGWTIQ